MTLIGIEIGFFVLAACMIPILFIAILGGVKEMREIARIDALLDASPHYALSEFPRPGRIKTRFSGNSHQRRLARRQQARAAKLGNA